MAKVELKQPIIEEISNCIKDAQGIVPVSYTHLSALVEEKKSFQAERSAEEGFSGPGGKCRTGETGRYTISGRTSGGLRRAGNSLQRTDPGD